MENKKQRNFKVSQHGGIVIFDIHPNVEVDARKAMNLAQAIERIHDGLGRPFPMLTRVSGILHLNSAARKYLRQFNLENLLTAHAVTVENNAQMAMMKFITVLVANDDYDIDVFLDETEAIEWLKARTSSSNAGPLSKVQVAKLHEVINQLA